MAALLLRMSLVEKARVAKAAAEAGVSLNAFILAQVEKGLMVTTDDEEGRKQVEEMTKPPEFKPGDWVRLKAGVAVGRVVRVEDYGNQIVCEYDVSDPELRWETHSRASLVHCEPPKPAD